MESIDMFWTESGSGLLNAKIMQLPESVHAPEHKINDMPYVLKCSATIYADDSTIYYASARRCIAFKKHTSSDLQLL